MPNQTCRMMWGKIFDNGWKHVASWSFRPMNFLIAHRQWPFRHILYETFSNSPLGDISYSTRIETISTRALEPRYITLLLHQSPSPQRSHHYRETIHHNLYNCGMLSKWQPPILSLVILGYPSILVLPRISSWSINTAHYSVYIKASPPSLWDII